MSVVQGFMLFGTSIFTGAKIIFTSRKTVWLLPGYSIALFGHRYLENGIAPIIAKRYLGNSAWSQIMVGGSNFGELLGALFVFLFTNLVTTPIPWLRLDALALLIVWYLPYWRPGEDQVKYAWIVAATFLPISFGWAAGDVSLAAYIQASLARKESSTKDVSALGAVMAFLYSTYIVIYAIANPLLGRYVDGVFSRNAPEDVDVGAQYVAPAVQNIAGVMFTVISIIMLCATLIPKGALSLNPKALYNEYLDKDLDEEDGTSQSEDEKTGQVEGKNDFVNVAEVAVRKGSIVQSGVL